MHKLKVILTSLFLLMLMSCSTTPGRDRTLVLSPPSSMLSTIPELSDETFDSTKDIIVSYTELAKDRNIIAGKFNSLVQWIRDVQTKYKEQ